MAQRLNSGGDGIARGIVAGGNEKAKEVAEFMLGQGAAIAALLQKQVQNAERIARFGLPAHQFLAIDEQLCPGGRVKGHLSEFVCGHLVRHMAGEIRVGIGDQGIALFHHPRQVFFWRATDAAQHPHRQLAGDVFGGVKAALFQSFVEDRGAKRADHRLEPGHPGFEKAWRP